MAKTNMVFITESKATSEKITVSARIDKELHNQFEEARRKVKAKGMELRLTSLVENAIKLAIKEAEKLTAEETTK